MLYFIDGSNLLGAQHSLNMPGAGRALLATLDRFCRKHRDIARVIFDGMEGGLPGDVIRFSEYITAEIPRDDGRRGRADRLILRRLKSLRDLNGARLVTDDRELAHLASDLGITIEPCAVFLDRLNVLNKSIRPHIEDEKERAARAIDNSEFMKLWGGRNVRTHAAETVDP